MADLVIVVAELQEGKPKKITYELLSAAREVAEELDYELGVAVLGEGLDGDELATDMGAHGAEVLFLLEHEALASYDVEPYAAALQQLIEEEEPEVVLFGMTPIGRDLAPRISGKLGAGLASDITGLTVKDGELLITRPIYSAQIIATVKVNRPPVLVTVRPNTWAAAVPEGDEEADVEEVELDDLPEPRTEILSVQEKGGDRPDLTEAARVVSGGRGFQGPENFDLLEELADAMDAAIGTTRAVVDADWRPYEEQVGQTGKTVSPQLYVAIGVSGAIQHISGMRTSNTIVAINKDPDAPIFRIADYGIVADLFDVVPVLTEEVKKLQD
ncbi:MAG: electron transfer flavoprotein subunit alpha/FixB family protein [Chloroflexota bacterium]|nr:electron transfer flavoprotein subunit alpha/FixB family protein [Chloroflexota bacterium]